MKKYRIYGLGIFVLLALSANAQSIGPSTLNAASGSGTIGGNVYEYSIAEMALVNTAVGANIVVTQGVLQPAGTGIGIADFEKLVGQINVYPNPTQNLVYIVPNAMLDFDLDYTLTDASGRILVSATLPKENAQEGNVINIEQWPAGVYTLMVFVKNTALRSTYKIEKVH